MTDESDEPPPLVGYGNPPKETRFKQGKSGNPKGRPKGSKNFAIVLQDELKAKIVVTEGGKRKKISKREAIAKQLVNKAAAGDPKAMPILFNETRTQENLSPSTSPQDVLTSEEDQKVMASIINRIRASHDPETQPKAVPDTIPVEPSSVLPKTEPELRP